MRTVIRTTLNPLPDKALVHFMSQEKLWLISTGERSHPMVPGTYTFEVDPLGLVRWGHYSVHGCTVSHECSIRLGFGEFEAGSEPWTLYHLPWVILSFIFYYHLSNAGSWEGLKPIPASPGKDRLPVYHRAEPWVVPEWYLSSDRAHYPAGRVPHFRLVLLVGVLLVSDIFWVGTACQGNTSISKIETHK